MICKYCLTKIDDDSVFCESCGSRVREAGNNDETQLLPKVQERVKPSRSAAFAANGGKPPAQKAVAVGNEEKPAEKDVRVNDISKLLAEIYDYEDEQEKKIEPADELEVTAATEPEFTAEPVPEPDSEAEPEQVHPAEDIPDPDDEEIPATCILGDVELPAEPKPVVSVFCMACGRKLPKGAAFCDICGTPTGDVEPAEIKRRKIKNSIAVPILKEYFVKPASALEKADCEEAFTLGTGVLLIKDILMALIAALCMNPLTPVLEGSWLLSADSFGFGAKIFLIAVLADVILLALIFGTGILFKAAGSFKEIASVCGTAVMLPAILWMIALILTAFAPQVSLPAAAVSLAVTVVFTGKAIVITGKADENKAMYMVAVVMVIYIAVMYGGLKWMIA